MSPRLSRIGAHGGLRQMPVVPDPITLTWGFETNLYEDNGNSAAPDPFAPWAENPLYTPYWTTTRDNNLAHSGTYSMHIEGTPPNIYEIYMGASVVLQLNAVPKSVSADYYVRWTNSAFGAGMAGSVRFVNPTDSSKFISIAATTLSNTAWTHLVVSSTNQTSINNVFALDSGYQKTRVVVSVRDISSPGQTAYHDYNIDDVTVDFTF